MTSRRVTSIALAMTTVALVAGLLIGALGGDTWSTRILNAALAVLVALPVISVVGVLLGYVRARDWRFAAATAVVLALLVVAVRGLLHR